MTTQDLLLTLNNIDPLIVALPESHKRTVGIDLEWIEQRQEEGNDIYFCPNTIKGLSRQESDVTAVNACFIDVDGTMPMDVAPDDTSICGRDETHWHAYWALVAGEDIKYWKQVQRALADHFGSDPAVVDPPRLMRLPGTMNLKEDIEHPHRLVTLSERTWTLNEIIEEYGLELKPLNEIEGQGVSLDINMPDEIGVRLTQELKGLEATEGERYATGRRWMLKAIGAGMELGEARGLLSDWFEEMGYSKEHAERQAANTQKGLVEKLETGKVQVMEELRPDLVFPDDEPEGTGGGCDNSDIIVPKVDVEAILLQSSDLEGDLLDNSDALGEMTELSVAKMTRVLRKAGKVPEAGRPSNGQISASAIEKIWKMAVKDCKTGNAVAEKQKADPDLVDERKELIKNVWCIERGTQFGYYLYDTKKKQLRPVGKDQEIESWIRYINTGKEAHEANLWRDRAYNSIHSNRVIAEFDAVPVPFGDTTIEFEPLDDGKHRAISFVSLTKKLEVLQRRYNSVSVPDEFIDFLDKEYFVVWVALKAALARRFLGDKRSIIWIKCPSDWGKTFFFALDGLAIFMDNGYDSDYFKGNSPADFAGLVYAWIDEAHKFTKEMKQDALPYRKLYGGKSVMRLPARIIASANAIQDLEDGSDEQLINRVCKLDAKPTKLRDRLDAHGWDNNIARTWYEKLVVERMLGWLQEWEGDLVPGAGYYRSFCKHHQLDGKADIVDVVKTHFWHHFLFDHVKGNEFSGFRKKTTGWAWGDEASDYIYLEGTNLYVKRVKKFYAEFVKKELGEDKKFMAMRSAGSIEDITRALGGETCSHLPRNGGKLRKWEGFRVNLLECDGLEELSELERV